MKIKNAVSKIVIRGFLFLVTVLVFSPLISLICANSSLGRHTYYEISFQVIAKNELPDSSAEEITRAAVDYTRGHLRLFADSRPYSGKPFDYLIEGVGWCDYQAKVLCKLLAAKGIPCRYAFLMVDENVANSPHTVAEVYIRGKWVVVDPLFGLIYQDDRGERIALEEATPEVVSMLPQMVSIKRHNPEVFECIMAIAERTYPLPYPPQRSDDFLSEKHIFDLIADKYVQIFGIKFAHLYQDIFLNLTAPKIQEPARRLWYKARNYHLYGRKEKAHTLYRQILAQYPNSRYQERTEVFLKELPIQK